MDLPDSMILSLRTRRCVLLVFPQVCHFPCAKCRLESLELVSSWSQEGVFAKSHTFTATNDEVLGRAAKGTANDKFTLLLTAEMAYNSGCFHIHKLDLTFGQVH